MDSDVKSSRTSTWNLRGEIFTDINVKSSGTSTSNLDDIRERKLIHIKVNLGGNIHALRLLMLIDAKPSSNLTSTFKKFTSRILVQSRRTFAYQPDHPRNKTETLKIERRRRHGFALLILLLGTLLELLPKKSFWLCWRLCSRLCSRWLCWRLCRRLCWRKRGLKIHSSEIKAP
jgi:hypothetical protein